MFTLDFVPTTSAGYVNIYGSDITKRKKVEEALREAHQDLNRAQAAAQTGSWRLDAQPKLFELFERLQRETHPVRGLGLGLVVCQRLVEA